MPDVGGRPAPTRSIRNYQIGRLVSRQNPPSFDPQQRSALGELVGTPVAPAQPKRDWLATGVAVLAAVLAFGGAALGSWITSKTSTATIQAERDQAIEQFRRDQRRDQYALILQQATRLRNAGTFSNSAVAGGIAADVFLGQIGKTSPTAPTTTAPPSGAGGEASQLAKWFGTASGVAPNTNYYDNPTYASGLGLARSSWQDAYTGLDQAISNAEIASSDKAINLARALRDKYRDDYSASILTSLDAIIATFPDDKKPDRQKLADSLVGVPAPTTPPTYDMALLQDSTDELTTLYVNAAKADLGLNDR